VEKTVNALNDQGKVIKGARVLILGISYKKDVDDQRESPSLKIISLLRDRGASVDYNDPHVPHSSGHRDYPGLKMSSVKLSAEKLRSYDAVLIATDHSAYDFDWIVRNTALVVDTRNAIRNKHENVVKA